ncbi:ATP-binding cassette domain-containing protein [Halanaerobacter jeridensis]|uniref:ABC transport system ATP-binding protein n=1 Tax=Halanaerobacter jeridensis TaxID=706427 RepID=A0A939BNV4_9FIRM|nr:ATP-binding cassette domain-containing protein [Halanaerobacter jeridensis]MBM7556132.1 putative ABC transport system ATP-binding protein [Halanaerobacter jeridensis]
MFSLENVKFKDVLDIKELKFPADEITCIVGPSGGGKTTLLKLLNNLVSVDEGQVLYRGQDVEKWDPIELRQEVIMISQQPVTFTETVGQELQVGFEMTGRQVPKEEKLKQMMQQMQLDKKLSTSVDLLSGGEKQRLALARSLLLNREVLLLDEPSSALDQATEEKVIQQLANYGHHNDITLIMVTHSLNIAQNYGDNTFEVKEGKIV